jgi:hypothetical protein
LIPQAGRPLTVLVINFGAARLIPALFKPHKKEISQEEDRPQYRWDCAASSELEKQLTASWRK